MITTRRTLMSWPLILLGITGGVLRAEPQTKPLRPALPVCELGLSRRTREHSCHSRLPGKLKGWRQRLNAYASMLGYSV